MSKAFDFKDIALIRCNYLLILHRFFELFEKYGGYKSGKLKLKKPKQLQVSEIDFNLSTLLFPTLWLVMTETL